MLTILAALMPSVSAIAAEAVTAGNLDPSFLPDSPGEPNGPVVAALPLPDGKILIVGAFTQVGNLFCQGVARLNSGGTLDNSFNPGAGADNIVNCVAIQADGEVLIGGLFQRVNGVLSPKLARLNVDGSVDPTFHPGFDPDGNVNAIAIQPDGLLVVGGNFTVNGHTNIVRLKSDGSIDPGFAPELSAGGIVNSILIQPDQRVLVAGTFTSLNQTFRNRIGRLNPDGSLDSSFDPGTGANGPIYTACVKTDGTLMIGGRFSLIDGSPRNYLAALNADGSLSTAFSSGAGPNDAVYALAADHDATLVAGRFTEFDDQPQPRIAHVLADGSLDGSFQANTGPNDSVFSIFPVGDSKVFIGGSFTSVGGQMIAHIARAARDGTPDPDFNPNRGVGTDIYSVIALGTGQVLIGGGFQNIDGNGQSAFARLQSNGSLDRSFRPPLTNSFVGSAALQKTGKIVISGIIYPNASTNFLRLARLNPDGSLDTGFTAASLDGRVQAIGVQPDDRIVVIGSFLHFNGLSARGILRLNPEGDLDPAFNSGLGPDNNINALAIQTDGRIVIGGDFTKYNGVSRNRITRLNADGSLDASFNPLARTDFSISAVALQPGGRILVAGDFQSINGTRRSHVARLLNDGTLDASFDPGVGPNSHVGALFAQGDGKVIMGGFFTAVDGLDRNQFARLNADGSLDSNFQIGSGADLAIYAIALQADNRILIGGSFGHVDGHVRSHIARLLNDRVGPRIDARRGAGPYDLVLTVRADGSHAVGIEASEDLSSWIQQGDATVPSGDSIDITVSLTNSNWRFYRAIYQ